jgi:hypothetical protein
MNDFEEGLCHNLFPLRHALVQIVATLDRGRESHPSDDGYRQKPQYHVECARQHLQALAEGDLGEQRLANAATRLLLALEASLR